MGRDDPNLVRNQPALQRGSRRRWLIPATLLAVVAIAMLVATAPLAPVPGWAGAAIVLALLAAMYACAAAIRDRRRRNLAFAWLMGSLGAVAVIALSAILVIAWSR